MAVTKQDVVDILNTVASECSVRGCLNIGTSNVIESMLAEAMTGELKVLRIKGRSKWGKVRENSDVGLNVTRVSGKDLEGRMSWTVKVRSTFE